MHSGELDLNEKFKEFLQAMNSGIIRGLRYHVKTDTDTGDMIFIDSKLMRVIKLDA